MNNIMLAVMADRSRYKALISAVPMDAMGTQTKWLLESYGTFFTRNPEAKAVDFEVLRTYVAMKLEGEAAAPTLKLISAAEKAKATPQQVDDVVKMLYEKQYSGNLARLINEYEDGKEVDLTAETYSLTMGVRKLLGSSVTNLFKEPDIHDLLKKQAADYGLKFRQVSLQTHIKGILPPINIAFCAAVDSGKTSWLADALTFMAPQCVKMFPDRPIIWLSNEGVTDEIWPRLYSAALEQNGTSMAKLTEKELYSKYEQAIGGNRRLIKLLDIHGWNMAQIAGLIEEMNPIIVVLDMLANVKTNDGDKKHEKMESLNQEWRELQALHNFIGIGTVQLSMEGYNMLYPPGTALKETKVGFQGALDIQIMMGKLYDQNQSQLRGFSIPKNKRKVVGRPGDCQAEVFFDPDTSRFRDS